MKSGKVFAVMGVLVACATGGFIAMRKFVPRAEALPFAGRAPMGTVLYVALPDHAAFADAVAASPAWKAMGFAPLLERLEAARAKLAEVAGPSAGIFVRKDGTWAALLLLRGRTSRQNGEAGGLHWIAQGNIVSISDSPESAEAILLGPTTSLELEEDRMEVCGAARTPFAWLDLRPWLEDDGAYCDIGAIAFTATVDETVKIRAIGNYYTRARTRAIRDFVHHPTCSPVAPPGAALWIQGMVSAGDLWPRVLAALKAEDRERIRGEFDRLSVEQLKRGSIEQNVIPRIGPAWGAALLGGPRADVWVATPEGFEVIVRRFTEDFADYQRRRELQPLWTLDGARLQSSLLPPSLDPSVSFANRRLSVSTQSGVAPMPSAPTGRWHVAAGLDAARLRAALEKLEWGPDARAYADRLRSALDRAPWLHSLELHGRYTDRGLLLELSVQ